MRWIRHGRVALLCLLLLALTGQPRPTSATPLASEHLLDELSLESSARAISTVYRVRDGDTLLGIADLLAVDVQTLQQINDLSDPNTLQAGMLLIVPDVPDRPMRYGVARQASRGTAGAPSFVWPAVGPITTRFGEPGSDWIGGYHMGLDIGAPAGAPVVAAADGTVEEASDDNSHGYGNHVLIAHGNGYETLYAHLSRYVVKTGQTVSQGALIGYVGATGFADGPHLHFEVRHGGIRIDPEPLLP